MKKLITIILAALYAESSTVLASENNHQTTEKWIATELAFESATDYSATGADNVEMDVVFTHEGNQRVMTIPAFWDGGKTFRVRFAPTLEGRWSWTSVCPADKSLADKSGTITCQPYTGNLDIYRHGFLKTKPGVKHLMYDDGTPFFYLGDTHWGMYTEEYDEPGPHAGQTGASSHFKYIVDRRVEQGFTVYQSEPIGAKFNLRDGRVDQSDIEGFQMADKYYQYIAQRGLVHANAEFFFAADLSKQLATNHQALRHISRYWVARFGAYPVMWTMAQEVDNDFYYEIGNHNVYSYENNPWIEIAEYIHTADAYSHPLSAHQENSVKTSVTGKGCEILDDPRGGGGRSVFADDATARRTGHTWWAAQWSPALGEVSDPEMIWDYWTSPRPAVNYEGRYCGLWTKDFGSRAQGWISYLSGFFGYGYGAIDIWLYKSNFDIDRPSFDGVDSISISDKKRPWSESVEYPSAHHMRHLRTFMEQFDWWNLVPVLHGNPSYRDVSKGYVYAKTAHRHIFYFYARNRKTGVLRPTATTPNPLTATWYNPRTGTTLPSATLQGEAKGFTLPEKPDADDWVLIVTAE
ncbi:MAG: DUF4038 domain-containing protein [Prevotella sp.]|nr:DUF4038 domain-containing protein [Prevotella sp.]